MLRTKRVLLVGGMTAALTLAGGIAVSEIGQPDHPGVDPNSGALIDPIPVDVPTGEEVIEALETEPESGETVELDAEGQVLKELGETGVLSSADGASELFTISIDSAEYSTTCPDREGETLTIPSGEFLILHVTAAMAPEMAEFAGPEDDVFMPVFADMFVASDAAGVEAENSGTAWGCYSEERILPFVEPGSVHEGLVVLEVQARGGSVTYDPDGSGGWTWALPEEPAAEQ